MTERAKFKGVINLIIKDGDKILLFFRNDAFAMMDFSIMVVVGGLCPPVI